jgi:transcriptional regulator with XRE-family HTH domain
MPRRLQSLAERVQYLVDRWHDGSVNAAATEIGVPEPTLRRIAAGDTVNPRLAVLQKIARHYRVGLDWLATGSGDGPAPAEHEPTRAFMGREWLNWVKVVQNLGLTPVEADAVLHLPAATVMGWNRLAVEAQKDRGVKARDVLTDANAAELVAWTKLLSGLVDVYGKGEVVRALRKHIDQVRLGFAPLPLRFLRDGVIPINLREQFEGAVDGLLSEEARHLW